MAVKTTAYAEKKKYQRFQRVAAHFAAIGVLFIFCVGKDFPKNLIWFLLKRILLEMLNS
jgi:hypothetical protein